VVVGQVLAYLTGETAGGGVSVDEEEFDTDHVGKVGHLLGPDCLRENRVVRSAGGEPGFGRRDQIGQRSPDRTGHRQLGKRLVRWNHLNLVGDQPETVAEVA